jgi:purine-binding chemotaxis protein CheW
MEDRDNPFLVFENSASLFAVDALYVRETFSLPEITPLEETPLYVVGVINLRGRIVPVMDLNLLFGRAPGKYRLSDCVIVLDLNGERLGIIVNEARDVMLIPAEDMDPAPFPGMHDLPHPPFVVAEARVGEDIIMILDHERLMAHGGGFERPSEESEMEEGESEPSFTPPHPLFSALEPAEKGEFHHRAALLMEKTEDETPPGSRQVAVIVLGGEYFGIGLESVREFTRITNLTPLPNCPEHVVGNMNLRGSILTLLDLRALLEMPPGRFGRSARVVVVSVEGITAGIAVDEIHDIASLSPSDIAPLPASARQAIGNTAQGTARYGDGAMTILDIGEILRKESLNAGGE